MTAAEERVRGAVLGVLGRIAPEADPAGLPPDAPLRRELDLDSVDFQNFTILLCRELGIDIPERDAQRLTSIGACIALLTPLVLTRDRSADRGSGPRS
jgi:acyl carrier protein